MTDENSTDVKSESIRSKVDAAQTEGDAKAIAMRELRSWLDQNYTVLRIHDLRTEHILVLKLFIEEHSLRLSEVVLAGDRARDVMRACTTFHSFCQALPASITRLDLTAASYLELFERKQVKPEAESLLQRCGRSLRVLNLDGCEGLVNMQCLITLLNYGVLEELSLRSVFEDVTPLAICSQSFILKITWSQYTKLNQQPAKNVKLVPPWTQIADDTVPAVTIPYQDLQATDLCRAYQVKVCAVLSQARMTTLRVNDEPWQETGNAGGACRLKPRRMDGICPDFSAVRGPNGRTIRELDLGFQQLTSLHDSLSLLNDLEQLDISHNQLKTIPAFVGALPKLTHVLAQGNAFKDQQLQRMSEQSGAAAEESVSAYLRKLSQVVVPQDRLQLLVLGHGCVGKSTLVRALQMKPGWWFNRTVEPLSRTTHVTFHQLTVEKLHFSIRDFPGQPQYYATNAHFLSADYAIVAIVCSLKDNASSRELQLRQWLSVVDRLAQWEMQFACKTIIVCTHADECTAAEARDARSEVRRFAQEYPSAGVLDVLALHARDVCTVHKEVLPPLMQAAGHIVSSQQVPVFVNRLRAALDSSNHRRLVRPWMSVEDFQLLVRSKDLWQDVLVEHQVRSALVILATTGDVLQLGSWVVCQPQLLGKAMAAVVEPDCGEFKGLPVSETGQVLRASVVARLGSLQTEGESNEQLFSRQENIDRVLEFLQILDVVIPVRKRGSDKAADSFLVPSRLTSQTVSAPTVAESWSVMGRRFVCAAPHQFPAGLLPVLACRVHYLSPQAVSQGGFRVATRELLLVFDGGSGFVKLSLNLVNDSLTLAVAGPKESIGWNMDSVLSVVENALEEPRWGNLGGRFGKDLRRELLCSHCVRATVVDISASQAPTVVDPNLGFGGIPDLGNLARFEGMADPGALAESKSTSFYCQLATRSFELADCYGRSHGHSDKFAGPPTGSVESWSIEECAEWLIDRVPELAGYFLRHPTSRPTGAQLIAMTSQDLARKLQLKGISQRQFLLEDIADLALTTAPRARVHSRLELFAQMDDVRLRHEHIDRFISLLLREFPDPTLFDIVRDPARYRTVSHKSHRVQSWITGRLFSSNVGSADVGSADLSASSATAFEVLSAAWSKATSPLLASDNSFESAASPIHFSEGGPGSKDKSVEPCRLDAAGTNRHDTTATVLSTPPSNGPPAVENTPELEKLLESVIVQQFENLERMQQIKRMLGAAPPGMTAQLLQNQAEVASLIATFACYEANKAGTFLSSPTCSPSSPRTSLSSSTLPAVSLPPPPGNTTSDAIPNRRGSFNEEKRPGLSESPPVVMPSPILSTAKAERSGEPADAFEGSVKPKVEAASDLRLRLRSLRDLQKRLRDMVPGLQVHVQQLTQNPNRPTSILCETCGKSPQTVFTACGHMACAACAKDSNRCPRCLQASAQVAASLP